MLPRVLDPEIPLKLSLDRVNNWPMRMLPFMMSCHSLQEVQQIVGEDFPYELKNKKLDLPELQGEPEEVAKEKCRLASERVAGMLSM